LKGVDIFFDGIWERIRDLMVLLAAFGPKISTPTEAWFG
jgi:hypothetical protein